MPVTRLLKKGQESGEITNKKMQGRLPRFICKAVQGSRVSAKVTSDKAVCDDIVELTMSVLG